MCVMWRDHLQIISDNRKSGAVKAAKTRRHKRKSYPCGVCGAIHGESDEAELWVGCDRCNRWWYHGDCVNITKENEPEKYYSYIFACEIFLRHSYL